MKTLITSSCLLLFSAGCSTVSLDRSAEAGGPTAQFSKAPDWENIDRPVQRTSRELASSDVQVMETVEHGLLPMSDDDYRDIRSQARTDIRKENPNLSRRDIEREAMRRANEAKWKYETSPTTRATWTWKRTSK